MQPFVNSKFDMSAVFNLMKAKIFYIIYDVIVKEKLTECDREVTFAQK